MVRHVVVSLKQHLLVVQQLLLVYQLVYMVVNLLVILLPVCMMVLAVAVVVGMLHVATIHMDDRQAQRCPQEQFYTLFYNLE
jgi:hypothetical protein